MWGSANIVIYIQDAKNFFLDTIVHILPCISLLDLALYMQPFPAFMQDVSRIGTHDQVTRQQVYRCARAPLLLNKKSFSRIMLLLTCHMAKKHRIIPFHPIKRVKSSMVTRKFCISTTSINIKMTKHVDRIHDIKDVENRRICANFEVKQGITSRDENNTHKKLQNCLYKFRRNKLHSPNKMLQKWSSSATEMRFQKNDSTLATANSDKSLPIEPTLMELLHSSLGDVCGSLRPLGKELPLACHPQQMLDCRLPHPEKCPPCDQEDVQHILPTCVFAHQFWHLLLSPEERQRKTKLDINWS
jgi:hypothetical protein